ncbi:hypothetical protein B0H17DRAFT_24558 [Mycena rosella]|uniref:Uncharacterized protein n=1 Tax=Mycena rosella TaxID=1033263 RepID=A0AAD7B3V8_MYCRO|nr:hypothetical protein B0H17DRAFT_24558 [Mycena rosella]
MRFPRLPPTIQRCTRSACVTPRRRERHARTCPRSSRRTDHYGALLSQRLWTSCLALRDSPLAACRTQAVRRSFSERVHNCPSSFPLYAERELLT